VGFKLRSKKISRYKRNNGELQIVNFDILFFFSGILIVNLLAEIWGTLIGVLYTLWKGTFQMFASSAMFLKRVTNSKSSYNRASM